MFDAVLVLGQLGGSRQDRRVSGAGPGMEGR